MTPRRARLLLITLGLACGGLLMFGFVAALLIVLAQSAGAGHRSRYVAAAGKLWRSTPKVEIPSQTDAKIKGSGT